MTGIVTVPVPLSVSVLVLVSVLVSVLVLVLVSVSVSVPVSCTSGVETANPASFPAVPPAAAHPVGEGGPRVDGRKGEMGWLEGFRCTRSRWRRRRRCGRCWRR